MSTKLTPANAHLCRQRLLKDIEELKQCPYPGIEVHIEEDNLHRACLILAPPDESPLHLTIYFTERYPLDPPWVTVESQVAHPNVFQGTLCINLLRADDGYTPAYTLKGICIQLLSFFASDIIEQMWGEHGGKVDRKEWAKTGADGFGLAVDKENDYRCKLCGFGGAEEEKKSAVVEKTLKESLPATQSDDAGQDDTSATDDVTLRATSSTDPNHIPLKLTDLPAEILMMFLDHLDTEDCLLAAGAWHGFGNVIRSYNIIRSRELQCFTLKRGFLDEDLGIGVRIKAPSGHAKMLESDFDILSRVAYENLRVQSSVQGIPFQRWLPLAINRKHWLRVRVYVRGYLDEISSCINVTGFPHQVIFNFMNDVVVNLSQEVEELDRRGNFRLLSLTGDKAPTSPLFYASEKAIESYFHLFHLLLCFACENPNIVRNATATIEDFQKGRRDKQRVPNIGHFMITLLLSDVEVNEPLTRAIIQETITRNVVFMLDPGKTGFTELAFLETDPISHYRLEKTYEAGKIGYRLLMFQNMMRKLIRQTRNVTNRETGEIKRLSLLELADQLFSRHGAPPPGAATQLTQSIKDILAVNSFSSFLKIMDIANVNPTSFTGMLRQTVKDSVTKGYSQEGLKQSEALYLRLTKEPAVGRPDGMTAEQPRVTRINFFPAGGRGGRGARGGRERARGRGG